MSCGIFEASDTVAILGMGIVTLVSIEALQYMAEGSQHYMLLAGSQHTSKQVETPEKALSPSSCFEQIVRALEIQMFLRALPGWMSGSRMHQKFGFTESKALVRPPLGDTSV